MVIFLLFFVTFFLMLSFSNHYMIMLIYVEFVSFLMLSFFFFSKIFIYELSIFIINLVVLVCMGVLGLSLLVKTSRYLGKDFSFYMFLF